MKIKTSELTGAALDWAVAKCEGLKITISLSEKYSAAVFSEKYEDFFDPSVSWFQGGPIVHRERMTLEGHNEGWQAIKFHDIRPWTKATGPTPLIAAMRCLVASKLGDEVEIPEELK